MIIIKWWINYFVRVFILLGTASTVITVDAQPVKVDTVKIKLQPMPRSLDSVATLEATKQVLVAAETGGKIVSLNFDSGDTVVHGDVLVQLNDLVEQAQLKELEAHLSLAKSSLRRSRSLENIAATRAKIEEGETQISVILAEIERTKALIDQKQIRAPFGGSLGVRRVNIGEYLKPGAAVVSLTDTSHFLINIIFAEQALGKVHLGQQVSFSIDAYPDKIFEAKVTTVEPVINVADHRLHVQATVLSDVSEKSINLRPGLFARAKLKLDAKPQTILVPELAVAKSSYGDWVYVVQQKDGGWEVESRMIKTGDGWQGLVEVVDGLQSGERIVISGQNRLYPGTAVTFQSTIQNQQIGKSGDAQKVSHDG